MIKSRVDQTREAAEEPLWSHRRTSEFLGVPEATLHALNYKQTGPRSFKVGRHRKYRRADVLAWLEQRASDADIASQPRGVAGRCSRAGRRTP